MRGTPEIDKDRYPFAAMRIGEAYKLAYMPNAEAVLDVALPLNVAERAAALVNAAYYDHNTTHTAIEAGVLKGKVFLATTVRAAVLQLRESGDIDGAVYSQVIQRTWAYLNPEQAS